MDRRLRRRAERSVAAHDGRWRARLDEPAAVDYLLLQELFKNQDAFRRSTFLAKGTARPLEFGPIWDFDQSMGSVVGGQPAPAHGWVSPGRAWAADALTIAPLRPRVKPPAIGGVSGHVPYTPSRQSKEA